jgi:hypothetical protein
VEVQKSLWPGVRWPIREHGGEPSSQLIDELFDERRAAVSLADAVLG